MSLMDELRRLARPYEDEEDYEEDFELEEPFVETKEERKTRGRKREEDDMERDYARLATLPRQAEWEAHMAKFQKAAPGATSQEKWKLMTRIFKL